MGTGNVLVILKMFEDDSQKKLSTFGGICIITQPDDDDPHNEQESTSPSCWVRETQESHALHKTSIDCYPTIHTADFPEQVQDRQTLPRETLLPMHRSEQLPSCSCVNTALSDHWSANLGCIGEWIFNHYCESKKEELFFLLFSVLYCALIRLKHHLDLALGAYPLE